MALLKVASVEKSHMLEGAALILLLKWELLNERYTPCHVLP
jgi:hypothetical protein